MINWVNIELIYAHINGFDVAKIGNIMWIRIHNSQVSFPLEDGCSPDGDDASYFVSGEHHHYIEHEWFDANFES